MLAVVRLVVLAWFAWCVKRTYHQEDRPEVRRFYGRFGVVGGFWLVSLPVYSLVATTSPSWHRSKRICICSILIPRRFAARITTSF